VGGQSRVRRAAPYMAGAETDNDGRLAMRSNTSLSLSGVRSYPEFRALEGRDRGTLVHSSV
jgi:hypothetical protein